MDDKDRRVLQKLQSHTESILRYCQDCRTLAEFEADSMRVEATVFNLMQIGELAKVSLSDSAKATIPGIPWKQIYGPCGTALCTGTMVWICASYGTPRRKIFRSSVRSWLLSTTKGRTRFHPSDPQPDPRQQITSWTQRMEQHRTASQICPSRSIRTRKHGFDPHSQSS